MPVAAGGLPRRHLAVEAIEPSIEGVDGVGIAIAEFDDFLRLHVGRRSRGPRGREAVVKEEGLAPAAIATDAVGAAEEARPWRVAYSA
jgi:hypothetical protein